MLSNSILSKLTALARPRIFVSAVALVAIAVACQKPGSPVKSAPGLIDIVKINANPDRAEEHGPWIDPEVAADERTRLKQVFGALQIAAISAPAGSKFEKIFGGTGTGSVAGFTNDRVHYVLSPRVEVRAIVNGETYESLIGRPIPVVASNTGSRLFQITKEVETTNLRFTIGSTPLEVKAPSNGLIHLGEGFMKLDIVDSMLTMVHEARHGDCESTDGTVCGFYHVKCPVGHEYENRFACDSGGVGAYYIEAVYAKMIAETCANCNETDRQIARLSATDAIGRVMNPADVEAKMTSYSKMKLVDGFDPGAHRNSLAKTLADRKSETGAKK